MRSRAARSECVIAVAMGEQGDAIEFGRPAARRAVRRVATDIAGREGFDVQYPSRRAPVARTSAGERLWISLSHRDGRGAAAASRRTPVGIDLERVDRLPSERARFFLTSSEQHVFRDLPLSAIWSLKEAAWKALELSDDTPFHALELARAYGERDVLRAVVFDGIAIGARAALHAPWPGWVLAVVQLESVQ